MLDATPPDSATPGHVPRAVDSRFWLWIYLAPAFAVLAVFLLTVIDPFELEHVTERQLSNWFYKLYSVEYPQQIRDDITVVSFNDNTLTSRTENWLDERWPPSQLVHSQILKAILEYEPEAVLVDIYLTEDRPSDHFENTAYVAKQYAAAKVPLYFIAADPRRAIRPIRTGLQSLADDHVITLVSAEIKGDRDNAPLYPLNRDSNGLEPAAVALYHAVCSRIGPGCQDLPDDKADDKAEEMEVVWGEFPAQFNCRHASDRLQNVCANLSPSLVGRAAQLLWAASMPKDERPLDPIPLRYHAAVAVQDLFKGGLRRELEPLLKHHVVIYAADVSLQPDKVFSPVHDLVDGAFFHAMALDNLLTYGRRVIHRTSNDTFRKTWVAMQPTGLMLLASLVVIIHRRRLLPKLANYTLDGLRERDERFLRRTRLVLYLVIALIGVVEFSVSRISPYNWIGLLIVIHLAHWIDRAFLKIAFRHANGAL